MSILDMFPSHPNCINCGSCCGENIPATQQELMVIREFIKTLTEEDIRNAVITQLMVIRDRKKAPKNKQKHMTRCQFRDEVRKKCLIYPVRPFICKLFGIAMFPTEEQRCTFGSVDLISLDDSRIESYMSQRPRHMPRIL